MRICTDDMTQEECDDFWSELKVLVLAESRAMCNQANRTLLTSLSICGEDIDNLCAESIKEAMKVCFTAAASLLYSGRTGESHSDQPQPRERRRHHQFWRNE